MDTGEITKLLEEIASRAEDWHAIGEALRTRKLEEDDPLRKLAYAFDYMYTSEPSGESRGHHGVYAPLTEWTNGAVYPPRLSTLQDDALALYDAILQQASHPLVCSRLADLLWVRKWGERPDLYARQALHAYLDVAPAQKIKFGNVNALQRALEVCAEINDSELKKAVVSATVRAISQELAEFDLRPGISMSLLEALMRLPESEIPNEIENLLEFASCVYGQNSWVLESLYELKAKRLPTDKLKEVRTQEVMLWVKRSDEGISSGIARMADLEHALELARKHGLAELAEEIRYRIQSFPEDELNLKTVSASVSIPEEEIDKFLGAFADERGWRESLVGFGMYGPPSGRYEENVAAVDRAAEEYPLQFLVSRSIYTDGNAPLRVGKDMQENKLIAVSEHEMMGITIFGRFAPEILQRITAKHGTPSPAELTEFFTTSVIPKDIAENIATAFHWYNNGEYDVAAHLLVPRLEAVIRELARKMGLVVIREPVGEKPGGVVQLGTLLTRLAGRMDESWRRYLYNSLANPIGVNLRNRISHGLIPKATKEDAGILIHVACHLSLLEVGESQVRHAPEPK